MELQREVETVKELKYDRLYVYSYNNPVNYVDVNGLFPNPFNNVGNWLGEKIYDGVEELGKFSDEVVRVVACADWGNFGSGVIKILLSMLATKANPAKLDAPYIFDTFMDGIADIFQAFDSNSDIGAFLKDWGGVGNVLGHIEPARGAYDMYGLFRGYNAIKTGTLGGILLKRLLQVLVKLLLIY